MENSQLATLPQYIKDLITDGVQSLLDKDPFELEDQVSPVMMDKLLYYLPEIIRLMELATANAIRDLKNNEHAIWKIEDKETGELVRVKSELLNGLAKDVMIRDNYKNEQMRDAYVMSKPEYSDIRDRLVNLREENIALTHSVSVVIAFKWKYANLQDNIKNMSKREGYASKI